MCRFTLEGAGVLTKKKKEKKIKTSSSKENDNTYQITGNDHSGPIRLKIHQMLQVKGWLSRIIT